MKIWKTSKDFFQTKATFFNNWTFKFHIDLFGQSKAINLGGNHYAFVIVDDFSIFIWVIFLNLKDEFLNASHYYYY